MRKLYLAVGFGQKRSLRNGGRSAGPEANEENVRTAADAASFEPAICRMRVQSATRGDRLHTSAHIKYCQNRNYIPECGFERAALKEGKP